MNQIVIICVDDEPMILDSLRIELEGNLGDDYLIELAQSGEEALEIFIDLKKDNYEIPIVIADYIMPDMKGDELLKRIHSISPQTLKIMLTGQADIAGVGNAINYANLYRYIPKPWESEDLKLTVKEALNSYFRRKEIDKKNADLDRINQELTQANLSLKKALEAELKLTASATKFVPHQFLSLMGYQNITDVKLGDSVEHKMSVLFADIRNFTTILETMTPEESFKFINGYLSIMEPAIIENQGFIDKYIGDAIMALFASKADDAIHAGISMLKRLNEYNKTRQRPERLPLKVGIGINTGDLILGTVGGAQRIDGTVIGDAVNLASRLEQLTKQYDVSLLISNSTFIALENSVKYSIRLIDRVKVKGKAEIVTVFEIFDADPPECLEGKTITKHIYEEAIILYYQRKFRQASQLFQDCLSKNPKDRVAQIYLERCQKNRE
ncbi:MAG: response regulator [Okeania sp. SIO3B5]|uniref:adenylate/guanylate cyclase domain-containing protein n=1 Tax=Okeania sp. SIO3B5 TaxID=2607811 RepID=UPI0013FF9F4D|nr:adenylate/guanylate cyclase domain-containing protein [Okeania sp. SIO3B5]NEO55614.1 response regulator [Okeania sp. SIO3B5]